MNSAMEVGLCPSGILFHGLPTTSEQFLQTHSSDGIHKEEIMPTSSCKNLSIPKLSHYSNFLPVFMQTKLLQHPLVRRQALLSLTL